MCPFIDAKKIQPQNRKSKKLKLRIFLVKKFFYPTVAGFFMNNTEAP
jgi:hypothetical protein